MHPLVEELKPTSYFSYAQSMEDQCQECLSLCITWLRTCSPLVERSDPEITDHQMTLTTMSNHEKYSFEFRFTKDSKEQLL